jgi:hypothetical protein
VDDDPVSVDGYGDDGQGGHEHCHTWQRLHDPAQAHAHSQAILGHKSRIGSLLVMKLVLLWISIFK